MLQNTFCHIPGIGPATEKKLWEAGVTSWDQWQEPAPVRLPNSSRNEIISLLENSDEALDTDPSFFTERLASHEVWRIFPQYRHQTAYIDIETTGLAEDADLTTIALYDGAEVKYYVNGRNLDDFLNDIWNYKVLVSYNGKSFDIPFLERYFKITLDHAQIDLRYVLARLGFKGGLKGCEKMLGIDRGGLEGVDGYFAVLLWREYKSYNDESALETLLAYNIEDTVNLEQLMIEAYNRNISQTPFAKELKLPHALAPPLPFQADLTCVERIKRRYTL
ncbi:ribonuclease H-like domain-containing protein [Desulfosediminicola ganghwensis]|uniref:ribonuclease H-like domain-containing protein n=1 Tax=Desulfosediminicola ganghwensis TaxID=2569540 RepID=UPI0010ABF2AF|nr:ribonuclease H-like domain-containing protein [Desulfosediminicola ganghwensis]